MTTKHTPGPWSIGDRQANNNTLPIHADIHIEPIASILPRPFYADTQEANARLIAAAPEILSLLESLTFIAETVAHLRGLERDILPTTDKARELIARVKG